VASFVVVGIQPGGKGCLAFGVVGEGMSVSPLSLESLGEAFDLPVLPGTVWLDEYLRCTEFCDHGCEAVSVSPGVISHNLLDSRNPRRDKNAAERERNPAQVAPFSSGSTSEYADRGWSSTRSEHSHTRSWNAYSERSRG